MNIAVYCGSVFGNESAHAEIAAKIGEWIGKNGHTLVFGGSDTGLMGAVSDSAMKNGAKVIGVVPNVRLIHERKHTGITELIYTETMSERKDKMIELSDAYIALPGGYGTLDEISDVLCLNRLQLIDKPIVLVDSKGFYAKLREFTKDIEEFGFVGSGEMDNVLFSDDPEEIACFVEKRK